MAHPDNPLATYGFTPECESQRFLNLSQSAREKELRRNLEAYVNEVLTDQPVSLPYSYYPDEDGEMYTDPSKLPIYNALSQFDPRERAGLYVHGYRAASQLLLANPGRLVAWYSPAGPAAWGNDGANPYAKINYDYGQLYLQHFDSYGTVKAVAVKVNNEEAIRGLFPVLGDMIAVCGEQDKITQSILHPQLAGDSGWLDLPDNDSAIVYIDKQGGQHDWQQVRTAVKNSLFGQASPVELGFSLKEYAVQATASAVAEAYALAMLKHGNWQEGELVLSGSCGGKTISTEDVFSLFMGRARFGEGNSGSDLSPQKLLGLLSSFRRGIDQREEKWDYHEGKCANCGTDPTDVGPCNICKTCEKVL